MKVKRITWRVAPKATGPQFRAWPIATYPDADGLSVAGMFTKDISYSPHLAEITTLMVWIDDHSTKPRQRKFLRGKPRGVTAATKLVELYFSIHPEQLP